MDRLDRFFNLEYGNRDYTDKSTLDEGTSMLISSQGVDNGVYGFFDIPLKYKPPLITVPRTGSIGYAFVQLTACNTTDDCIMLLPKDKYNVEYFFYIATIIRKTKWRYNYGRKITPNRLAELKICEPYSFNTKFSYNLLNKKLFPSRERTKRTREFLKSKNFPITELFNLERGQFHAIDRLEEGNFITISRTSDDNGLVGFYKKPRTAKEYPALTITVSSVTGDAFLQTTSFIATDNVVMCIPKNNYKVTTLLFVVAAINKVKWRYSYGRQPYKGIFAKTTITLPVSDKDEIDERFIEELVANQPYWNHLKSKFIK